MPLLSLCYYLKAVYQCQILSCQNVLLITDVYIYCQSTFLINKSIICQDAGEEHFLLHHLKNVSTRSLFFASGFFIKKV